MKAFIDKLLVIEEMITQRRKLACHLTGKERFQLEGLCALGFMFAPIAAWFLIPYCKKRLHHPRYGVLYWRVLMMPVLGCVLYLAELVIVTGLLSMEAQKRQSSPVGPTIPAPCVTTYQQVNR